MTKPPLRFGARRAPTWLAPALACLLALGHAPARADLWSHVDEQGVTHFAAEQIDERYQLYYKGADVSQLSLTAETRLANPGAAQRGGAVGLRASAGSGDPAFKMPQRFAAIDDSRGYKAVQKHLREAAKQHSVDYELLKAVVAAESGFDPTVVSPKGAVGLMQLLPTTATQYGVVADKGGRKDRKGQPIAAQTVEQKLTDPRTNIFAGARYLSYLLKLFKGETSLAVAAYNAGEGAVQRAGNKIPNFKETQGYVRTVMGLYGVFKPAQEGVRVAAGDAAANAIPGGASSVARALGKAGGRVRVELEPGGGAKPRTAVGAPMAALGPTGPVDAAAAASDSPWAPLAHTPPPPAGLSPGE